MKRFDIEVYGGRAYLVGNPVGKYVKHKDAQDTLTALFDVTAQRDQLKAMSIEHILIDVVPGHDGMGHEVYAKSVDDVNALLSKLSGEVDELEIQRDQLKAQRDHLLAALALLLERIPEPPDANCSCHISPPCNDCVDYAGEREAFDFAKEAISKVKGGTSC